MDAEEIGKILLLEKLGKGERGFEVQGGVTSCLGFMGVSKMGNVMLDRDLGVVTTAMGALGGMV